ncbi:formin-like protein 16 [Humulus lupulus]|uniref:formin-like protein 16 n=1 Tax=Humulus lupulus TaxID=3486 RepID=UPI002B4110A7|nr:formin-like protein 16 [Humulus lupulus]XP_062112095.1 formin-like protein 16 [Humulus lupulus]XP_062112097.1 formin-like protein 16 [Humulus lupulus]
MVTTRSRHGNEIEQHDGQEAHHTTIPDEQVSEVQQWPGKQPVGQDDTGSSASRPPNPNPCYYTAVEMENAQLRSQLATASQQIQDILARLPPLTTGANVGDRQGEAPKSRRGNWSRHSRLDRLLAANSTPSSHHREANFEEMPRTGQQQYSRSVRTSTPSSQPSSRTPRGVRENSRRRSGEGSQRQPVPDDRPVPRPDRPARDQQVGRAERPPPNLIRPDGTRIASPVRHPPSPIRYPSPPRPVKDILADGSSRRNPPSAGPSRRSRAPGESSGRHHQRRTPSLSSRSHWSGSRQSDLSGGDLHQRLSSAQSHQTTQGGDLRDRLNSHRGDRVRGDGQACSGGFCLEYITKGMSQITYLKIGGAITY